MNKNIIIGINLGDYGSTGNIMRNSLEYANDHGDFDYLIIVPKSNSKPNTYAYMEQNTFIDKIDRRLFHKSLGNPDGLYEYRASKRIINKINEQCKRYKNVLVHLHNIHMAFIDFRFLFKHFSKNKKIKKVFYTIHDCWPYTGGCYYYSFVKCDEWQKGCNCNCLQEYGNKSFPVSRIWELKKKWTLLLKDKMMLLPVSDWIDKEIDKSFLSSFDRCVINGETNITNLGHRDEELIKHLSLENKKIVLTISAYWNDWKGYKYIYEVADKLPNDYIIVVVGGKFDISGYNNIIHIKEVPGEELNHYYSIADVYMSTSQSESLGLTTCEAQICGVPVVAFGHTAIKETFIHGRTGVFVGEDNNVDSMIKAIIKVIEEHPFDKNDIYWNGNKYVKYSASKKYLEIYKQFVR